MNPNKADQDLCVRLLEPEWRDRLPSTNSELVRRLAAGEELVSGYLLAAREQTAGRGRLGRSWTTAPGRDLCFSFALRTEMPAEEIASLPLVVGLGLAYGLDACGVTSVVKWPNDILVRSRKICGILCERVSNRPAYVVAGVGCNVNMSPENAARIDKPATSLLMETGRTQNIDDVLLELRRALSPWLEQWRRGGFSCVRGAWLERSADLGERVTVRTPGKEKSGRPAGFGPQGELLLEGDDGKVTPVWAGDIEAV